MRIIIELSEQGANWIKEWEKEWLNTLTGGYAEYIKRNGVMFNREAMSQGAITKVTIEE